MKPFVFFFLALVLPLVDGCASTGRTYSIVVRRPSEDVCFIEMRWQTSPDSQDEATWKTETKSAARPVIEAELHRLGLPSKTVIVESATPFEGGWVVVDASSGNLPAEELKARVKEILAAKPPGKRPPEPVYRGKGEFQSKRTP